jgi:hypothetical protein
MDTLILEDRIFVEDALKIAGAEIKDTGFGSGMAEICYIVEGKRLRITIEIDKMYNQV